MAGHGERWAAVRRALHLAALFQRVSGPGPASDAITGAYSTLSSWYALSAGAQVPRCCCSSVAVRWASLEVNTSISPDLCYGKKLPSTTVCCSLRTLPNRRMSCSDL